MDKQGHDMTRAHGDWKLRYITQIFCTESTLLQARRFHNSVKVSSGLMTRCPSGRPQICSLGRYRMWSCLRSFRIQHGKLYSSSPYPKTIFFGTNLHSSNCSSPASLDFWRNIVPDSPWIQPWRASYGLLARHYCFLTSTYGGVKWHAFVPEARYHSAGIPSGVSHCLFLRVCALPCHASSLHSCWHAFQQSAVTHRPSWQCLLSHSGNIKIAQWIHQFTRLPVFNST